MSELRDTIVNAASAVESGTGSPAPISPSPAPISTPAPAPVTTPAAPIAPISAPAAPAPAVTSPAPGPGTGSPTPAAPAPGAPTTLAAPTPPAAPADPSQATPGAAPAADPLAKAPGTWTPEAREHWQGLPAEVRQEVMKREREVSKALSYSTQARQFATEFERTMQPYMGFIAAERSTPLQAVNAVMQTAALLRVGTPQQKVMLTANLIQQYGIDLVQLDRVLAGHQVQQQDPRMLAQQAAAAAVAPYQQQMQAWQQQQHMQLTQEVDNELTEFAQKHEFYNDVKEVMADIMEAASKRGHAMSLTTAYERATLAHEPVRRVIEARRGRESVQQGQQAAAQARSAAVSIQGSPEAGQVAPKPGDSIRDAIEYAMRTNTQGR